MLGEFPDRVSPLAVFGVTEMVDEVGDVVGTRQEHRSGTAVLADQVGQFHYAAAAGLRLLGPPASIVDWSRRVNQGSRVSPCLSADR